MSQRETREAKRIDHATRAHAAAEANIAPAAIARDLQLPIKSVRKILAIPLSEHLASSTPALRCPRCRARVEQLTEAGICKECEVQQARDRGEIAGFGFLPQNRPRGDYSPHK